MTMLAFIVLVNEGKLETIKQKTRHSSKLTWLHEWLIYFEVVWGRFSGQWTDIEETYD
jgi:hypothetical protein